MSFWKRDAKPSDTDQVPADDSRGQAAKWTNGSALGSKVVTLVLIGGWLCAPIALYMANGARTVAAAAASAPVVAETDQLTALQQSTGSYAVGFVSAWLSATQSDTSALETYIVDAPTVANAEPFEFRNMAVASVQPAADGVVAVVVAADVKEPAPSADEEPVWARRYFQVAVDARDEQIGAVALPAPVAGPAQTKSTALSYGYQVPMSSKVAQTITAFFGAYLAGMGETEPYVSPTTRIEPISPAPFVSVKPVTFEGDADPSDTPAEGEQVAVLSTVTAENANGQSLTSTYSVVLTARTGRWEVTSIDTSPLINQSTKTPAPTETPANPTTK